MRTGFVSTYAMNATMRSQIMRNQVELQKTQIEISSGKKANIGIELGPLTSQLLSVKNQIQLITRIQTTSSFTTNRISTMQSGMGTLVASGQNFVDQLTAELNGNLDRSLLAQIGNSALKNFEGVLNVTFKGEHVFSGINSDVSAFTEYTAGGGSAPSTAVRNAFVTEFGFLPEDPAAASITPDNLEAFITGAYADLFNDANWQALWSGGSNRGMKSKISTSEIVEIPVTANAQAFRDMASATVLIAELSSSALNPSSIDKLAEMAATRMMEGIADMGAEQSKLGVIEERVRTSTERMDYQVTVLGNQVSALEDVDLYQAATRLSQISIILEASYSVTSRIQRLSLMNYI